MPAVAGIRVQSSCGSNPDGLPVSRRAFIADPARSISINPQTPSSKELVSPTRKPTPLLLLRVPNYSKPAVACQQGIIAGITARRFAIFVQGHTIDVYGAGWMRLAKAPPSPADSIRGLHPEFPFVRSIFR
jgi:hypothetical protein